MQRVENNFDAGCVCGIGHVRVYLLLGILIDCKKLLLDELSSAVIIFSSGIIRKAAGKVSHSDSFPENVVLVQQQQDDAVLKEVRVANLVEERQAVMHSIN